jgi:hypothetical protein
MGSAGLRRNRDHPTSVDPAWLAPVREHRASPVGCYGAELSGSHGPRAAFIFAAAVFSAGSIAWAGGLSYNSYDNNVARLTANDPRRFVGPAAFSPPTLSTIKETV